MKSLKYIYIAGGLVLVLAIISGLTKPHKYNWEASFSTSDKNPFGLYIFNSMISDILPGSKVRTTTLTLYEYLYKSDKSINLQDLDKPKNFIFINDNIQLTRQDFFEITELLQQGHNVFISGAYRQDILEELGLSLYFVLNRSIEHFDTRYNNTPVKFYNKKLESKNFGISIGSTYYFSMDSIKYNYTIHSDFSTLEGTYPVLISTEDFGGKLIVCSLPYLFTNINLLNYQSAELAGAMLSVLPNIDTVIFDTEIEDRSTIRFILSDKSLSAAYYLLMTSIIFMMIFAIKRKQRAIPVIPPLKNTSAEFVATVANLSFTLHNNAELAEKKISNFYFFLKHKLNLSVIHDNREFIEAFSGKTDLTAEEAQEIFYEINKSINSPELSDEQLEKLTNVIDKFYKKVEI
ncbi:MAG: hypothetical protein WC313_11645 [Candidatus Kapaibacterium sp.]